MRVIYDSTCFLQDNVGGIVRYFIEMANRLGTMSGPKSPGVVVMAGAHGSRVTKSDFGKGLFKGSRMPTFRGSWRIYKAINDLATQATLSAASTDPTILHETYYGAPRLWNRRVKRVITIYDMIWEQEEYSGTDNWVIRAKRASAEQADGILFISESTRQAFHRHYPQRCMEAVVHLGSELRTTRDRQPVDVPWPYILFVGRRQVYKNWARLVEAMGASQLWRTHGLVNVGSPLSAADKDKLRSAGVPDDRVMALRCDDDTLADLYTAASCFVFPSLVEGFGIPLLEAARCGCPIACSDIPVFREILPQGPTWFDPRSASSIATALHHSLAAGRRPETTATAKQTADLFSWQQTAEQTLDFYRSLFDTSP
jgi:glycosyltransferase involved in cell wall biosynthesis